MKKQVVIGIVILLLIKRIFKKPTGTEIKMHDVKDIIEALKSVKDKYGIDIARNVEKMFRLETSHFKTLKYYNSPGMENHAKDKKFPYGWGKEMTSFASEYGYSPSDFSLRELDEAGTGLKKFYVQFPSLKASMLFLAHVLKSRKNDPGTWYSNKEESRARYRASLNNFKPEIINSLT